MITNDNYGNSMTKLFPRLNDKLNSTAEVTPIRELDDRTIGDGKRGPITEKIQKTFFDAVYGRNDKYKSWLTYVK